MNRTKDLTLNALFMAITIVLAVVPNLGMIHLGPVSITIMHIPVIIAGLVLGYKGALINSLAFGISSMVISSIRGTMPLDVFFVNPLISIVPRLLFGLSIIGIFKLMSHTKFNFTIKAGVTAGLSSVLHTIFVLIPLYFFIVRSGDTAFLADLPGSVTLFIWATLTTNGFLEMVAAILIGVPVTKALRKMRNQE